MKGIIVYQALDTKVRFLARHARPRRCENLTYIHIFEFQKLKDLQILKCVFDLSVVAWNGRKLKKKWELRGGTGRRGKVP